MPSPLPDPRYPTYAGQRISLLTQHGKERVIAPILDAALGCQVERIGGYDTDQLGTFTRDIPRPGTQAEAARTKARIGMARSGLPVGIASEGAFGPDPMTGMFAWNTEIVILVDDRCGLELIGSAQGPGMHRILTTADWGELGHAATMAGFPEHHLVLRPNGEDDPRIRKGIDSLPALQEAFAWGRNLSMSGCVCVENDVRAHANPTRMAMIGLAAEDLVRRIASRCPSCGAPGFAAVERIRGLPCADCGEPTDQAVATVFGCVRCAHREVRPICSADAASPEHCPACNP